MERIVKENSAMITKSFSLMALAKTVDLALFLLVMAITVNLKSEMVQKCIRTSCKMGSLRVKLLSKIPLIGLMMEL